MADIEHRDGGCGASAAGSRMDQLIVGPCPSRIGLAACSRQPWQMQPEDFLSWAMATPTSSSHPTHG